MITAAVRIEYDWSTPPCIIRTMVDSIPRADYTQITLTITMGKSVVLTFLAMTSEECFKQVDTYHDLYLNRLGRRFESALG